MTWKPARAALFLALATLPTVAAIAQEQPRLRPDERLRPGPTDRPAAGGKGPGADPSIDDSKAVGQQDLVQRCREAGQPASGATGGALPGQANSEAENKGDCILPPTGQPLGAKAVDKLTEPK